MKFHHQQWGKDLLLEVITSYNCENLELSGQIKGLNTIVENGKKMFLIDSNVVVGGSSLILKLKKK